jgi:hypothetical protein
LIILSMEIVVLLTDRGLYSVLVLNNILYSFIYQMRPYSIELCTRVIKSTSILPLFAAVTGFGLLVTSYTYKKFIAS